MFNIYGACASRHRAHARNAASVDYELRAPAAHEGPAVHALVAECPPLDTNSLYCNLLQCTHFAETSAIALGARGVAGFVSGYRVPARPDTLFVWQVAVAEHARGQGLGKRLIRTILARPACADLRFISATVTPDNKPSRGMFRSLARELGAGFEERELFDTDEHFASRHDSEHELRIGPFILTSQTATPGNTA